MKIALVVPGGVDRSGEYRVVPAVLALLRRMALRHEVHVFALRQEAEPGQWMLEGACIHNIGGRRTALRAVAAIVREHRRGAPFDLVQALWSGGSGLVAVLAARLLGRPSAVHYTGGELLALHQIGYGGRLNWRGRLREALVLRGASRLTASSWPIVELIAELGWTAQRLPLGVDLQAWPLREPRRREAGEPLRLIHVASLNAVKDQATLLRAMALLSRAGITFHLDVVGEDTLNGAVQTLARHLKLAACTTFHGFMTQGQLRPLFEQAHIHLVSSLHEAGPFVLLEAAALGVPTVGTAVGHLREWAPEGAALAVPVGEPAALAAALRPLIEDEALRQRIGRTAQAAATVEDADRTAALFEALHASMAGGR